MTEIANHDVRVELAERSYDIHIGTGNLADIGSILVTTDPLSHAVIVTDTNVEAYATTVA